MTDGRVLPQSVPRRLVAGRPDDVPLLVGATADEWRNLALGFGTGEAGPGHVEAQGRGLREVGG